MAFDYLTNTPLKTARELLIGKLLQNGFEAGTETVSVASACGRVTAEAAYTKISVPHYLSSAMDGIAVSAARTFGATETTPADLTTAEYCVVDTGDPIPDGFDAVIMIEDVSFSEDGTARVYAAAVPWQHIRQIGEDMCAGEMIVSSYMEITPMTVGALLAGGLTEILVLKKPVIGIIPTGDELVSPGDSPAPGEIPDFNSAIFSNMLKGQKAETICYPIVRDDRSAIRKMLKKALQECDIVLINAGSSAGRDDYSAEVIGEIGEVMCHGLAIKPGKPAILGCKNNKAIIGIPGYPVSGIIVTDQIVIPLIRCWYREKEQEEASVRAVLTRSVVSGLKYEEFVRVRLGKVENKYVAVPLNRGSGIISSFMKADGIMRIPRETEGFEAGSQVKVRLMSPLDKIGNTLIATGSHDPLLDELANLLHRYNPCYYMSSAHVGSMGGLMAVRRGEAHFAGTHLLDPDTGIYNIPAIQKFFPNGGVYLIECVGRIQGIMTAAGNPENIMSVRDLVDRSVRYVNRQKGSGTRILFDYLCLKNGIAASEVHGYEREEFTHMSVAAQIASGTADAGMGIYSAAGIFGLDFIPVWNEQYDLLISDYAWNLPMMKELLNILKSRTFRERAEQLGGYELKEPGRVIRHFDRL